MMTSSWDARIARARELAGLHPAAAEVLRFYSEIARFQKRVYECLRSAGAHLETTMLAPHFAPLLALVGRIGPRPLADAAQELARDESGLPKLLTAWRDSERQPDAIPEPYVFYARALMQPYSECLAGRRDIALGGSGSKCPFCGEKPQAGILRPEGDGGKRSLVCSLCATEWDFRRILCPGCGEEAVDKLPVYIADEFDYVRVEACDSCRTYIKTVDLTKNGLAVPIVDELGTVSLNLWAEEKGYSKLQANLLGM